MVTTPGPFEKRSTWLPRAQETVCSSIEEAEGYVSDMFVEHELRLLTPNRNINLVTKTTWYGDTGLIVMDYNAHVEIAPVPLAGFVLVQIPLAGGSTLRIGNSKIESSPALASIPAQDQPSIMQWFPRSPHLCVYVKQERVNQVAANLYGVDTGQHVRLSPGMDLRGVQGQRFKQAIFDFHQDIQDNQGLPRLARLSEETLIARMLAASVNSVGQALELWPTNVSIPKTQRRRTLAQDFADLVDKHYGEDVSIADFAERLNVSMRALQLSVAAEFETTPSALLLTTRLQKLHDLLLDHHLEQVAISDLAMRCGFSHQGRMSAAYKRHYGQTPSQTRRGGHN